jgi:hypothetical protein
MSARERTSDLFTVLAAFLLTLLLKIFIGQETLDRTLPYEQRIEAEMPILDARLLKSQVEKQFPDILMPRSIIGKWDAEDLDYFCGLPFEVIHKVEFTDFWLAESRSRALSVPARAFFAERYRAIHSQTKDMPIFALKKASDLDELCQAARFHWAQLSECNPQEFQTMLDEHASISKILLILALAEYLQDPERKTHGWMRETIKTVLHAPITAPTISGTLRVPGTLLEPEYDTDLHIVPQSPSTVSLSLSGFEPQPLFLQLLNKDSSKASDSAQIVTALLPILNASELSCLRRLFATRCECLELPALRLCKLLITLQLDEECASELEWAKENIGKLIKFKTLIAKLMSLLQDRLPDRFLQWGQTDLEQGTLTKIALGLAKDIEVAKELMNELDTVKEDTLDYIIRSNYLAVLDYQIEPEIVVRKLILAIRKFAFSSSSSSPSPSPSSFGLTISISPELLECLARNEWLLIELRQAVQKNSSACNSLRFVIGNPIEFARLLRNPDRVQALYKHRDFIVSYFGLNAAKFLGAMTVRDFKRFYCTFFNSQPKFNATSLLTASHRERSLSSPLESVDTMLPVPLRALLDLPTVLRCYILDGVKRSRQLKRETSIETYATIHTALRYWKETDPRSYNKSVQASHINRWLQE